MRPFFFMEGHMDHYKGVNDNERYNNEMIQLQRRQVELLEQIAQLLQLQTTKEVDKPSKRQNPRGNQA